MYVCSLSLFDLLSVCKRLVRPDVSRVLGPRAVLPIVIRSSDLDTTILRSNDPDPAVFTPLPTDPDISSTLIDTFGLDPHTGGNVAGLTTALHPAVSPCTVVAGVAGVVISLPPRVAGCDFDGHQFGAVA